ncbi:LacI family DNA-binding transcriptional regulator [Jiella sp. MQZ13P-4]|uniref:LacI family DNA-binding transcriptional regulator n=2 Tax=Jiella sonneratiae TaxID=2816856 RepID=A0ABS3J014_9HYPH|nr:LacI family DNA-binding transcriptional regulator [Jiella sonneratiae]
MEDVGRLAGVSQVTVSRALRDPSKVSPDALRRIRDAVATTGYVPNAVAGALASNRSRLVTALVPSITNVVYSSLVKSFIEGMRAEGYHILLSETGFDPDDEEALIAAHLSRRPDAMLLIGIHHTAQARRQLLGAGIPVVEVWDITDTPIDMCVGFSHADAGRSVADFAAEGGYLAAATLTAADERARRRARAFAERFEARTGRPVTAVTLPGPASLAEGRRSFASLCDDHGFAAGVVFCSSDLLAHGALIEAETRGIAVPETVAVIGFGDQDFAAHTAPALTTVSVDRTALGRKAASALLARLAGTPREEAVMNLGFNIVRRGSA